MTQSIRPRLLLVPLLTELEWLIQPDLEEWAEVASFDAPGVGAEPPAATFGRRAIAERGLAEVDRRGWESWVLVADGAGIPSALHVARARPRAVRALALGHARLSSNMEGDRPAVTREVFEAMHQLLQMDYGNFVRYGLTQITHGSIGDELAKQMVERVPQSVAKATWDMLARDREDYEETIRALDVPLLFAKHEGCLSATEEGFEDAVAAFPEARVVVCANAPSVSSEFGAVLHEFVEAHWIGRP